MSDLKDDQGMTLPLSLSLTTLLMNCRMVGVRFQVDPVWAVISTKARAYSMRACLKKLVF